MITASHNIFISWSGILAKEITNVLRVWLPKMFDNVHPWASDVDIVAGMRGFEEIRTALDASEFGIIVVTTENMERPWLNFEAGALSKRLDGNPDRVVPLLVNFDSPNQLTTPLSQYQAVMLDQDGMRRLCESIAASIGLSSAVITARFDWAWPDLEESIQAAKARAGQQPRATPLTEMDLLEKLVASVDAIQRGDFQQPSRATLMRLELWRDAEHEPDYEDFRKEVVRIASKYRPVVSIGGGWGDGGSSSSLELKLSPPRLTEEENEQLNAEFQAFASMVLILPPVE